MGFVEMLARSILDLYWPNVFPKNFILMAQLDSDRDI